MTLRETMAEAEKNKVAIGHFNFSNLETLRGIFNAAQKLNVPVIVGVSEGERDFVGVPQAAALVKSLRDQFDFPIFLNADHTYSVARVKEAVDAGFDSVIFDGVELSLEENIKLTKECVDYAKASGKEVLVEGELGYIGRSSKLLDALPEMELTDPEAAKEFVSKTGVDLLAPAVGNSHGRLKSGTEPKIDTERIKKIKEASGVPLVLHGGSGVNEADFISAIVAGVSIVHINTDLRLAYRNALRQSLQENPDEIAPYKLLRPTVQAVEQIAEKYLKFFSNL